MPLIRGKLHLDSFLGSGTTAAVAHKMGRRYIGIEMGEHAISHCVPRLKKVVDGEQGGISEAVGWKGGGAFRFYKLGSPVFDEKKAAVQNPAVRFVHLARARMVRPDANALAARSAAALSTLGSALGGGRSPPFQRHFGRQEALWRQRSDAPVAGRDARARWLKGDLGESSRLSKESRLQLGITFKQTPYDVKAR